MPADEELAAWLKLSFAAALDGVAVHRLLGIYGSARAILDAGRAALGRHVQASLAAAITDTRAPEVLASTRSWLDDPTNRIVCLTDGHYPRALLQIADPPPLLYVK